MVVLPIAILSLSYVMGRLVFILFSFPCDSNWCILYYTGFGFLALAVLIIGVCFAFMVICWIIVGLVKFYQWLGEVCSNV